jgi:hypothetical protein
VSRAAEVWSTRWSDLPRPRDFKELDIDPPREIERIARNAREIEKKRREDAAKVEPSFEPGHYRDGTSRIHIGGGDSGLGLLYEFDQLIEQAGLPLRINHVNICADAATAAVGVAFQPNVEWHVWLLRALHDHMEKPFERHFSRVAIARMPDETSKTLIAIIESGIAFWTRRSKEARAPERANDSGRALDVLRLLVMASSRLTVRMPPDRAADALRRAVEMAKPLIWHYWVVEALGTLAKYAVKAAPPAEQGEQPTRLRV